MISSKLTTLLGILIVALGELLIRPDVQSLIPVQHAPVIQIIGVIIAAIGPSITRTAPSRATDEIERNRLTEIATIAKQMEQDAKDEKTPWR